MLIKYYREVSPTNYPDVSDGVKVA